MKDGMHILALVEWRNVHVNWNENSKIFWTSFMASPWIIKGLLQKNSARCSSFEVDCELHNKSELTVYIVSFIAQQLQNWAFS
jgi:hypothetical protein